MLPSEAAAGDEAWSKRLVVRRTGLPARKTLHNQPLSRKPQFSLPSRVRADPDERKNPMTNLLLRDNFFEDLFDFRRDFDELFNRILTGKPWIREQLPFETPFGFTPAIEAYVDKDAKKYVCRVSLPGVEPKDVEILTHGNMLTIKGEKKFTRMTKEVDLHNSEIVYGKFERVLTLPEGVVPEKLVAEFVNGVLEITAPVAVTALPRKIEIKTVPITRQMAA